VGGCRAYSIELLLGRSLKPGFRVSRLEWESSMEKIQDVSGSLHSRANASCATVESETAIPGTPSGSTFLR